MKEEEDIKKDGNGSMEADTKDNNTSIWEQLCEKNTNVPSVPFSCRYCGSTEHAPKDCPNNICNHCGKSGHYSNTCPANVCHNCGTFP